jgi:hypothetical protein
VLKAQFFPEGTDMPTIERMRFRFVVILVLSMTVLTSWRGYGQASVLTHHNDVARTGQNLNEIILNPTNVNAATFGKLFTQKVDGSIVGQPLYVPQVQFPNGSVLNVVYVATQHDSVFAFDADNALGANASPLWTVNFPKSVPDDAANYGCGTPGYTEIGIMGTPVIDPTTNTLYLVSKTLVSGQYFFNLHALDITSGAEKFGGPMEIAATVQTGSGAIVFTPAIQLQRPALLLLNGTVYIGFGSNGCDAYSYHGWLLAYSASTLQQVGVYISTPGGLKGSLWGSGGGPAADDEGFIYVSTANGTFDYSQGGTDFGDSFVKLSTVENGFTEQDYFTPYNQALLDDNDLDLGSGGLMILPDQGGAYPHEVVGGGKQGTLYLVNRDAMGEYNEAADMVLQEYPEIVPSIKTVPAYWNGNVYLAGQADYIMMFSINDGQMSSAPVQETSVLFDDRGPSISISANGTSDGILWAMLHGTPILYAFDATNLSSELYDTTQAAQLRDRILSTSRFVVPTIANGKVFVGGLNALYAFGILPSLAVSSGNNQSATIGTALPTPLSLVATDAYSQAGIPGVTVTCKDGGADGTFSNPTGVTNSSGEFSTNYTFGVKARTVTITCTATGYISAVFTETSIAGAPSVIRAYSGNQQTAPVGTPLPAPLVALVVDAHANPVQGAVVTFSDGGKGGSFSATTVATNASGYASTSYTTPNQAGVVKVTATVGSLKPASFSVTVTGGGAGTPTLSAASGNNQSGVVATTLPVALTVLANDGNGTAGVSGVIVTCKDGGSAGKFSSASGVTNASGDFSTSYTLPTKVKVITITCTATGYSSAVFTETAVVGPATEIKDYSGNKQTAPVDTQLGAPLVALVVDAHGNPIQGATVTFSDGGKGGSFSNSTVTTNASGYASTSYTTAAQAEVVHITATTGSLKPANFTATVTAQ